MKILITTIVFSLIFSWSFAQQIEISEAPRAKEGGTFNSYLFELPDVSKKEAIDNWQKFIGNFKGGKTKYNKRSKLYFSANAKMPRFSDSTVDVYAKIIEDNNPNKRTTVIIWFDLGDSYVSMDADSLKGKYAIEVLAEYAMLTSKYHAQEIVKEEEKRLAELKKDLQKLEKDNKNYYQEIEKAKESIAKNEKNVEVNELDQKNKTQELKEQIKAVENAKENVKQFNN